MAERVPGSCQVVGAREEKGKGCGERHKSVQDAATAITEHRSVEADRSELRRGGKKRGQLEAARKVGVSQSPPSVVGRRKVTLVRLNHQP